MKYKFLLAAILSTVNIFSQTSDNYEHTDTVFRKYMIQYDPSVLRISNKLLPIGFLTILSNGDTIKTRGFLKGKDGWSNYKVEVEKGNFCMGKIKINSTKTYKKYDSLIVRVYTRKWFLGKKDQWLLTQKIPYNYETKIQFLQQENITKAPGNHFQFGIRTHFDNNMFIDKRSSKSKNKLEDFILMPNGGCIPKSKSYFKIDSDPFMIEDHQVQMFALLVKNPDISDTLQIMLDYKDQYECRISSFGRGHDLDVYADVYYDTIINEELMIVNVADTNNRDGSVYPYLINTHGGSINVYSCGASGSSGSSGSDGMSGSDGSSGSNHEESHQETDSEGNMVTVYETVQGSGGNGTSGSDGTNGGDGGDGHDGGDIKVYYTKLAEPYLHLIGAYSVPGSGGSGGYGGRGGSGGRGGDGNPSGIDGSDGFSGSSGNRGKKGNIVFIPR